ncbi:MAG: type II toxin-antitoxin system ParD family antitoxin [Planctomycetota bacterium]
MTISVEIPADVEPFIKQAIASGAYANEQEVVAEVLRLAAPALESYRQLKAMVESSEAEGEAGLDADADFESVRAELRHTYDQSGRRTQ